MEEQVRLNKYMASCGIGSRRHCDTLIRAGKVCVNGQHPELGQKITPGKDTVEYEGRPLVPSPEDTHLILHKPRGVIVSAYDPHNPYTVYDLLKEKGITVPGLQYVGRLDKDSEGLLLFTTRGDLNNALTHPRFEIKKEYSVLVADEIPDTVIARVLSRGIVSEGELLRAGRILRRDSTSEGVWYTVTLYEGKNRQIRRMVSTMGTRVLRLIRHQFATLRLGDVSYGEYRYLTGREIRGICRKVHLS
ncbi:pseudouridine synthase [Chitinivibrio alkaliphilus]|uniref:Pseudouridine synthase n=1 Tax=Chitinivibrio alkaliphilus ACht1 TaxID=1313304 RepID=U7DBJ7_9BACT|nr:pseudouridine synthase [Chitinivibrio alkaliphilus]ERP38943.1 pseudouridine synthase, RsuA subfamily [Chitinivibrio alkaliphilus ACht1]